MPQLLWYIGKDVATAYGCSHGEKYVVFSYGMLSQLFSGFGTHGSGFKRKTFLVCWECASCPVLNNTVLLYCLVGGRAGGEMVETWCPWKFCKSASSGTDLRYGMVRKATSWGLSLDLFQTGKRPCPPGEQSTGKMYFLWPLRHCAADLCRPTLKPLLSFNVCGQKMFCHCFGG